MFNLCHNWFVSLNNFKLSSLLCFHDTHTQIMMPEARIHKEGSLKVSVDLLLHEIVGKEKEGLYIFDVS